jgi:hypothetical protein
MKTGSQVLLKKMAKISANLGSAHFSERHHLLNGTTCSTALVDPHGMLRFLEHYIAQAVDAEHERSI